MLYHQTHSILGHLDTRSTLHFQSPYPLWSPWNIYCSILLTDTITTAHLIPICSTWNTLIFNDLRKCLLLGFLMGCPQVHYPRVTNFAPISPSFPNCPHFVPHFLGTYIGNSQEHGWEGGSNLCTTVHHVPSIFQPFSNDVSKSLRNNYGTGMELEGDYWHQNQKSKNKKLNFSPDDFGQFVQ